MSGAILARPSAWIPLAMSGLALGVVLLRLWTHGAAPERDEGAAAHLWQLSMAGQVPVVLWFAGRWLRRAPRRDWPVLAFQLAAAAAAMLPVALLGW